MMTTFGHDPATARFVAIVGAAGDAAVGDAAVAVALLDGLIGAAVPLDAAALARALDDVPAAAVVALDARDRDLSGEEGGAAALAGIAGLAEARALPLIVGLDEGQIDAVFAALGGVEAQLLVDPGPADWLAALAVVTATRGGGRVREGGEEAERQARLNAEIARIAGRLAELGQADDRGPSGAADVHTGFAAASAAPAIDARGVRDVIRARRMRDRFFGAGLFEDPAWDMLLDLFAARLEGRQVSVSSLCIAAAVAPTTALRWINKLLAGGLFERAPDPVDRRRAFVALSPSAAEGIERYFGALADAGLRGA